MAAVDSSHRQLLASRVIRGHTRSSLIKVKRALSENLTKRPLLRNFLHPLNCEEPTLVTAIRLAMDERHRSGWFERDAEGAGLRLNWAGHGERLDEGVEIPGLSGLSAGDRRRAPAAQVVDQAQAGESQHALCGLRKTGAQDARGMNERSGICRALSIKPRWWWNCIGWIARRAE